MALMSSHKPFCVSNVSFRTNLSSESKSKNAWRYRFEQIAESKNAKSGKSTQLLNKLTTISVGNFTNIILIILGVWNEGVSEQFFMKGLWYQLYFCLHFEACCISNIHNMSSLVGHNWITPVSGNSCISAYLSDCHFYWICVFNADIIFCCHHTTVLLVLRFACVIWPWNVRQDMMSRHSGLGENRRWFVKFSKSKISLNMFL